MILTEVRTLLVSHLSDFIITVVRCLTFHCQRALDCASAADIIFNSRCPVHDVS
jgi:hypothetical protein